MRHAAADVRIRFGPFRVLIRFDGERLHDALSAVFDAYEAYPADQEPDLLIELRHSAGELGIARPLTASHWDFEDGFAARFGHFFVARWRLAETPVVEAALVRSPVAPVRPIYGYEFRSARSDIAKMLHENILLPAVAFLFPARAVVLHAATMVPAGGPGVAVTGAGGVGKTSLALELGRRKGWAFLSDDLVVVDRGGTAHLNANWPKIYAYNVGGDPGLERLILSGRSLPDRLHWMLRRNWPDKVRRSVDPSRLYRSVSERAPLGFLLHVVRESVGEIEVTEPALDETVPGLTAVTAHELDHFGKHAIRNQLRRAGGPQWQPDDWAEGLREALASTKVYRISVPVEMEAGRYRESVGAIVDRLVPA